MAAATIVGTALALWLGLKAITQVVLAGDELIVERSFKTRRIPLDRIRSVEHDFPGRGARRILLLIESADPLNHVLESIEFVPEGGESGLGGKPIAEMLRARVQAARAARVT